MFRHPHLNTYQKVCMCPPPWLGSEELGGCLGPWGCSDSKGDWVKGKGLTAWPVMLVCPDVVPDNIPQTPSKVVVLQSITFPIHQMKPCQLNWQKLVFLTEKLSFSLEYVKLKILKLHVLILRIIWHHNEHLVKLCYTKEVADNRLKVHSKDEGYKHSPCPKTCKSAFSLANMSKPNTFLH